MSPSVAKESQRKRDEAQSVMHIGSSVVVGVWPWAEIYVGRPGQTWQLLVPSPVDGLDEAPGRHPYESRVGNNCLGMRVFQIIPWRGGLVYQTTLKNQDPECKKSTGSLDPALLEPYGRVHYLDVPGSLSCPLRWTGQRRRIGIGLTRDGLMTVHQDGELRCSRRVADPQEFSRALRATDNDEWILPAVGIYGRPTRHPESSYR